MTLFIVNPKSGAKKDAADLPLLIKKYFPQAEIIFTERAGHARELAAAAAQKNYQKVIVCGGDGTINEAARGLVHTKTALGVIPRGSGNGFARELGMSLDNETALKQLQNSAAINCDAGQVNDELFINVAGIGIEAEIAHAFAAHGTRGRLPYFWLGLKTILSYKPRKIKIITGGAETEAAPLTLVFANGSQYGTNFKIAPKASLTDGLLDMVQVLNKSLIRLVFALPAFFNSDFRPFDPTSVAKVKEARVITDGPVFYHIDGEPKQTNGEDLQIKILPAVLKVLIPK
ncbi:MAG: diacylglycerol kinase family lipid kinase [Elusimicrobium sp.]|jgi:YegS/Rv2252/BmrU family lipid kinase|nr:diacylglycerol kinase family lipid kinase [Elusimicrobium sp.]